MSVVGIDFGNQSCVVAVKRRRGIDLVRNKDGNEEIPSLVYFTGEQHLFGEAAMAASMSKPELLISDLKCLIDVLSRFPFIVTEGWDMIPLINSGEAVTITPTLLLGMLFSYLKGIAQKSLEKGVVARNCCIGIPAYFIDLQRQVVLDAARLAGLNPLSLIHETTATALAYGVSKLDLAGKDSLNVVFVDVGHSSMQVNVVRFEQGKLHILAYDFDKSLGGEAVDKILCEYMAAKIQDKFNVDVTANRRAYFLFQVACEQLKKIMWEDPETPFDIEEMIRTEMDESFTSVILERLRQPWWKVLAEAGYKAEPWWKVRAEGGVQDDLFSKVHIKRDEFRKICAPVLDRMKKPLEKVMLEAGLRVQDISSVELVGSGSLLPIIVHSITEFFGKMPRRSMNKRGSVAKGCALMCEQLSNAPEAPRFLVEDPEMIEKNSIAIIESVCGGLSQTDLNAAVQQEICMVSQDRDIEPKDKEEMVNYLHDMRDTKLNTYHSFSYPAFEALQGEIEDVVDMLEDEDESLDDVIFRFDEVKKKCDDILQQEKEFYDRTLLIKQLLWTIGCCRRAIMSERGLGWLLARIECDKTEEWLNEKLKEQCALPIFASPVLLSADLRKKNEELIRVCKPIVMMMNPSLVTQDLGAKSLIHRHLGGKSDLKLQASCL
ncbi:hypothetical protein Droror1_Dr00011264 [Drosera rotundifolia]